MARKKENKPGYGKLLDAWDPPNDAGDPIGCVATSFTFSPAFFEEECLGRFLHLESDPSEDGPIYLVEREEKLYQLTCAAALVDQHHCRGARSLRWDLLPVRVTGGVLHAKVSLLYWSNAVRVILASANLTEDGYRRNQEVFGVLDYYPKSEAPVAVLLQIFEFLRQIAEVNGPGERNAATKRVVQFLRRVREEAVEWGENEEQHARRSVRVHSVLTTPGQPDAIKGLSAVWPGGTPPRHTWVISPFYDPPEGRNRPAEALWEIMRKRGEAEVTYCVEMEEIAGQDAVFVKAPENLSKAKPSRQAAMSGWGCLKLDHSRPLHAKAIWLEDDRWVTYMIGSSNFTSAGLGLSRTPNIEANLAYALDYDHGRAAYKLLSEAFPEYEEIGDLSRLRFQPAIDDGIDSASDQSLLPEALSSAIYDHRGGSDVVSMTVKGTPPKGWQLITDGGDALYSEADWLASGSPADITLVWKNPRPPSGLWVKWTGCESAAWLPVNVAFGAVLPPPDELKDLSLEALMDILTSAKPLHQAMRAYLARRPKTTEEPGQADAEGSAEIDPHRRIDTTGFLLQRTRRVSGALSGLRERLERPAASMESLNWRLRGPVGALALKDALIKEAKSADERVFLLSELALELDRCKPKATPGCLSVVIVRSEIRRLVGEIMESARQEASTVTGEMRRYVEIVTQTVNG